MSEERGKETQQKNLLTQELQVKDSWKKMACLQLVNCMFANEAFEGIKSLTKLTMVMFMVLKVNSHSNKISLWICDNGEWGAGRTGFNFYFYRSNYNIGLYIINS